MNQTDWIVVGAGTAGCMVASQLALPSGSDPMTPELCVSRAPVTGGQQDSPTVTIIEPNSQEAPVIDRVRPARWIRLLGSEEDWNLQTEAVTGLANRVLAWPRGRGPGGSSRINAMIWFPPTIEDFRMMSEMTGGRLDLGESEAALSRVRSIVQPESPRWLSETSQRFIDAMQSTDCGEAQVYDRFNRDGRRWSADHLLQSGMAKRSIQLVRSTVNKLVWKGDRIVGVEIQHNGQPETLLANRGVILTAGAIATPTILMRSGIGPPEILQEHDIDVHCSQPAVGYHLRDHLIMPVIYRCRSGGLRAVPSPRDLVRWQSLGTGPLTSNVAECGGIFGDRRFQLHVTPTHYLTFPKPSNNSHMTLGVSLTQPQSQGHLTLNSADPAVGPRIFANYLHSEADRDELTEAVRFVRKLAQETTLSHWLDAEVLPGIRRESNEAIQKAITRYAQTLYHPVGTCRMGTEPDCPVTGDFAFRQVDGLWIVDGSVLPRLTFGNPSATILLLSYYAAGVIREHA